MQLRILTSTTVDDSMKSINGDQVTVRKIRAAFLEKNGVDPNNTTLHTLSYGGDDYCRYKILDDDMKGDGVTRDATVDADAVVVTKPGHALLLPLADCIGAVIHDPTKNILMLSHLGRHNLEQFGGSKCIEFLKSEFGVDPQNLTVWLSPAAGKENYPLYSFNNRGMHDVAAEQLIAAGVSKENITASSIDTTVDTTYFSHSQFQKGNRETDGRFAVVAVMRT
jgi:copper oxidase (laccase) domain-containing protein